MVPEHSRKFVIPEVGLIDLFGDHQPCSKTALHETLSSFLWPGINFVLHICRGRLGACLIVNIVVNSIHFWLEILKQHVHRRKSEQSLLIFQSGFQLEQARTDLANQFQTQQVLFSSLLLS